MANYYEVLGISKDASREEIKTAYRKLARKYHAVSKSDKAAEEKLKEINQAYEVLENDQKRAAYDLASAQGRKYQEGPAGFEGYDAGQAYQQHASGAQFDIFDIFDDLLGRGQAQKPEVQAKGADIKYTMEISLEDAFTGIETEVSFTSAVKCEACRGTGSTSGSVKVCGHCRGMGSVETQRGFFRLRQTCPHCSGAGQVLQDPCKACSTTGRATKARKLRVSVPSGIQNEQHIRLAGEGEAGFRGGAPGSLFIVVKVKEHPVYKVKGADLYCKLPILFTTAVLGGRVSIPTLAKDFIEVALAPHTPNGHRIKIKGAGMPKLNSKERGDLFVDLDIDVPQSITPEERSALLHLQSLQESSPHADQKGFFKKMKDLWR